MYRIRRIFDDALPVNERAVEQVVQILRDRFDDLPDREWEGLASRLRDPFELKLRHVLLVAEDGRRRVLGFALLLHDPALHYVFLDYLASLGQLRGRGVGGSLYERARDEGRALGCRALFLECLPDDPHPGQSEGKRRENAARLRFYERYGARPVHGGNYQEPFDRDHSEPMPMLVADTLDDRQPIEMAWVRKAVRSLLDRRYGGQCPAGYAERVAASFRGRHLELRPARHLPQVEPAATETGRRRPPREPIPMVVNDRHQIHHVRDRGYVESPVRIGRILAALEPTGLFRQIPPRRQPLTAIEAVHDPGLVRYLRRASEELPPAKSLYPYVFPIRNAARRPKDRTVLAGYYCIDTFTPIHQNSFRAAKRAVECTLTAADRLLDGEPLAYSLVRPPGHHAERRCFGGFCYFNNAAVAAHRLSATGRVAILDIDYHHGNGQQDIFWERADVLTVSIHGAPSFAYPYFAGFEEEQGDGEGAGFNLNLPLPERLDGGGHRRALRRALDAVEAFAPVTLVLAFGLDPAKGDPTGTWSLGAEDFRRNGELIGERGWPTLVVQEGGYRTRTLGANARAFFEGLAATGRRG